MKILEPPDRGRTKRVRIEARYREKLFHFFSTHKEQIVRPLLQAYRQIPDADLKSFGNLSAVPTAFPIDDPEFKGAPSLLDKEIERLLAEIDLTPFDRLPFELQSLYSDMAKDGMVVAAESMRSFMDEEAFDTLLKLTNERSVKMALEASAELVGKKWIDGKLVDNPGIEPGTETPWRIDESTRELIRSDVSTALQEGWTNEKLAAVLMDPDQVAFSEYRADMVARTEMADIDIKSNYETWRESGLVKEKYWLLSSDPCDTCIANYQAGRIGLDDDFPEGDPPVHPNCSCDIGAVLED